MFKSPDHYSTAELIQSLEKELEGLKRQNKPAKNEKAIRDLEDRLVIMKELLILKR